MDNQALVLTAGGLKGAFQVGALSTILLSDENYNPKVISGISTGALTAAILAQSKYASYNSFVYYFSQLSEIYGNLDGPMGSPMWPGGYIGMARGILFNGSLERPTKLKKLIDQYIHPSALRQSGREFRCGSVNLESGQYTSIDQTHHSVTDFILASATIPALWPAVNVDGQHYVDGGTRNMFPLRDTIISLRENTPPETKLKITLLMTNPIGIKPIKIDKFPSTHMVLGRTVDILTHQILISDLKELISKNKIAGAGHEKYRYIDLQLIYPTEYYDTSLTADPNMIRRMSDDGMARAKEPVDVDKLEQILKEGNYV